MGTALIEMMFVVAIIFSLLLAGGLATIFISVMVRSYLLLSCVFHRCDHKVDRCRLPIALFSLLLLVSLSSCCCCCICVVVILVVYSCGVGAEIPLSSGTSFVAGVVILSRKCFDNATLM